MQNSHQPFALRSYSDRQQLEQQLEQGDTVVNRTQHWSRWFGFPQTLARTAIAALTVGNLLAVVPPAAGEPTLTFDPPPGTRLSNFDAYLTVTFDLEGGSWEALPWDWQNPRVRLNGTDISLPVRSLISGATASVLTPEEIVVSQQTMTGDRMVLALSGLRLDDGFNRLIVEFTPTQEGIEPLTFDVSYPVIAGQDQATQ
ncbi:MAG: hypothetical protein AAGE92_10020 [Cyanobacteria bacterium P01_G01_bin.4]